MVPWAEKFCGREAELTRIRQSWQAVVRGEGPRAVALIAESGLGKTRIAQEFFARLSTDTHEGGPDGYWPDRMTRLQDNLAVNPDPAECDAKAEMRFLWWGIRMADPLGRNAVRGGVVAATDTLGAHLAPFAAARLRAKRRRAIGGDIALDLAAEVANIFTFGLAGLAKTAYNHADAAIRNEIDRTPPAHDARLAAAHKSLADTVVEDFRTLFSRRADHGPILPAVLFLDDAQWMHLDAPTLQVVKALLSEASSRGWPLMILATYWEMEWRQQVRSDAPTLVRLLTDGFGTGVETIFIKPEPDLGELVRIGLPGLPQGQVRLVLDKAGGNPRLLDEILRHFRAKPRFFEGRNIEGPLTQAGLAYVSDSEFDLHELIFDRLRMADPDIRLDLGVASVQGLRFCERLVYAVRETLQSAGASPQDSIARAADPFAMVNRPRAGIAEFAQRVYWEVAREQLDDFVATDDVEGALRTVLRNMAGPDADFPDLNAEERALAWRLAVLLIDDSGSAGDAWIRAACLWHLCFAQGAAGDSEAFREDGRKLVNALGSVFERGRGTNATGLYRLAETAAGWGLHDLALDLNRLIPAAIRHDTAATPEMAAVYTRAAEVQEQAVLHNSMADFDIDAAVGVFARWFKDSGTPLPLDAYCDLITFSSHLLKDCAARLPPAVVDRIEHCLWDAPADAIANEPFAYSRALAALLQHRLVSARADAFPDVAARFKARLDAVQNGRHAPKEVQAPMIARNRAPVEGMLADLRARADAAGRGIWQELGSDDAERVWSIAQLRAYHRLQEDLDIRSWSLKLHLALDKEQTPYMYVESASLDGPEHVIVLIDLHMAVVRTGGRWLGSLMFPGVYFDALASERQVTYIHEGGDGKPVRGWLMDVRFLTCEDFRDRYGEFA